MRFGRLQVDLLRYYAKAYDYVGGRSEGEKRAGAYFPLPFGAAVIVAHARSFDPTAPVSCSLALYNCALMAQSLGLATCHLGFVESAANMRKGVRRWLRIPEGNRVYGAMVIGRPGIEYRRLVERRAPRVTRL